MRLASQASHSEPLAPPRELGEPINQFSRKASQATGQVARRRYAAAMVCGAPSKGLNVSTFSAAY